MWNKCNLIISISDSYEEKKYSLITFELNGNALRSNTEFVGSEIPPNLTSVTVLGVAQKPKSVLMNGVAVKNVQFDKNTKVSRSFF